MIYICKYQEPVCVLWIQWGLSTVNLPSQSILSIKSSSTCSFNEGFIWISYCEVKGYCKGYWIDDTTNVLDFFFLEFLDWILTIVWVNSYVASIERIRRHGCTGVNTICRILMRHIASAHSNYNKSGSKWNHFSSVASYSFE